MKRRWILIGVVLGVLFHQTAIGQIVTVDSAGDVGKHTSLAIVNGNPAISYYDATNGNLKYARATDVDGSAWGAPVTVDSNVLNVGLFTCLAVVNGNPAISYYDTDLGALKYIRADDINGETWSMAPVTVDDTGDAGEHNSLAVVNGRPAISYFEAIDHDLRYVRATDVNGNIWGAAPVSVDSAGVVGSYTSLAVVNGNPAVSYYDIANGDLQYVRATDADGNFWGGPVTVDSAGWVGLYTSLVVINGNPAISYFRIDLGDLKYARASDTNGDTWGIPLTLDSAGDVGQNASLAVINGNPGVTYYDDDVGDLKYVRAADANGSAWSTPIIADSTGAVGRFTSLTEVNGNPAASYYDFTNGDLKFWFLDASTIPALNEWGMIIFALLVCGIAIGVRRGHRTGSGFNI